MIKFIYKRPIAVLMLILTTIIFGMISLFKLPITLMPPAAGNVLAVVTRYHGVSPEQIEKIITTPIENAVGSIEGIKEIYSVSQEGESRINIFLNTGKDIEYSALKIREAVETAAAAFPKACEKPYVLKNNADDKSVFIFNLKSRRLNIDDLRTYAEHFIKKDLSRIDGISEIDFSGGSIKEIHIEIDPDQINAYNIGITNISSLIQQAYFVNTQGKITTLNLETGLYSDARFTSLNEIALLPVFYDKKTKKNVLLKDVARVYEGYREKENISKLNGEERVSVYIRKSGDANTLNVCNQLIKYLNTLDQNDLSYEIIYNQGEYITRAINNVRSSGLIGGIIAVIVLIAFIRNIKAIILISLAMPFSIIFSFFLMYIFKIGINVMTLSGFALGIGMLLDNGIVMIETLSEDLSKGAWEQSTKIISPIFSSNLTTIAIFFPILFLNEEFRQLYSGLALTVTFSLAASILAAIVIIPAGYGMFHRLKKMNDSHHTRFGQLIEDKTMNILRFFWKKAVFIAIAVLIIVIVSPFILINIDKEYIDPVSSNELTAYVEMEAGTSLAETERLVNNVDLIFRNDPNILRVNTRIQKWHADIDLKYNIKKFTNEEAFIGYLKKKTDLLKDCFVHYEQKSDYDSREIDIDIIGDNDEELRNLAMESSKRLSQVKDLRIVLKFKEGKPSLTWIIDRDKCQSMQVPIESAGEQLRWAIYEPVALKYIKNNKELDLRIGYQKEAKKNLEDVKGMMVFNDNNQAFYIKDLGSFEKRTEPGKIYRKNKRKTVRIGVTPGNLSLSKAIEKIKTELKAIKLKEGYYFDFGDKLEKLQESQTTALFALLLSVFIIYCILAIQFESFLIPLQVIPIIPVSIFFVVLLLYLFKMSLNLSVYIGLIILSGIVINNTILITSNLKDKGTVNLFSVHKTIQNRLKPVFITTLTTILALIPMIIQTGEGAELWRPLAITLFSGLLFGTFINLTLYPLIYLKFNGKKSQNGRNYERKNEKN